MAAMDLGRTEPRVEGWRHVTGAPQGEQPPQDVGRGRGSPRPSQRVVAHTRSPLTRLARQAETSAQRPHRFGWTAFVTKAGQPRLSWQEAVVGSRTASRVARVGHRLKSRGPRAPLGGKRHAPIEGLTSLLTLGVRVCTVMACVLRQSLQHDQAHRPGLHPANQANMTDQPPAERIRKACADVSLTLSKTAAGEDILRRRTPVSGWQEDILPRQGCGTALYRQLEMQNMSH
jgi:hypothetical protein